MPNDLFPNLNSRLGVVRRADPLDDLELAQRRELAEQAERDLARTRSTDIMDFRAGHDARQRAAQRRQKDNPGVWVDALVESIGGRSLAQIVGSWAQGLPKLIGASNVNASAFTAFQQQFWQAINALGLVVAAPTPSPNSANKAAENRRKLRARSLGVTNTKIAPSRPESCRRFDELAAHFSQAMTLGGVMADGNSDGLPIGAAEVIGAWVAAMRNSLLAGDTAAAAAAGQDAGALLALLWQVTNGGTTAQRKRVTRASGAPMVELSHGIYADFDDCERGPDGQPRLKAGRGSTELRRRIKTEKIKG